MLRMLNKVHVDCITNGHVRPLVHTEIITSCRDIQAPQAVNSNHAGKYYPTLGEMPAKLMTFPPATAVLCIWY